MRKLFLMIVASFIAVSAAVPAAAQDVGNAAQEQAIREVIVRLFDGMRSRDTAMISSTFSDQALFFGIGRDGNIGTTPAAAFVSSIAQAPAGLVLDEVVHDVEIRIDRGLATAWMYYDFFAGEDFSHCGYNAMQLLRVRDEWKIVALADTRSTEGCRKQR